MLVNWVGYTLFFMNPKIAWPLLNRDYPEFCAFIEANWAVLEGFAK